MSFRSRRFLFLLMIVALFAVMTNEQHSVLAAPSLVLTPTAEPPTATPLPTETPVPPTATPLPTETPVPPTATPLPTETPVPPTATPLPTNTPVTQPTGVVATETPPPPAPTNTPQPAATNQPAATSTPTTEAVVPTATPEPPVVLPVTGATMPGIPWLPIALGVAVFAAIGLLLGRRSNL
jgi:hypothetical protein